MAPRSTRMHLLLAGTRPLRPRRRVELGLGAAGAAAAACSLYLARASPARGVRYRRRPAQRPVGRPAPERLVVRRPGPRRGGPIADCVASLRRDAYPDRARRGRRRGGQLHDDTAGRSRRRPARACSSATTRACAARATRCAAPSTGCSPSSRRRTPSPWSTPTRSPTPASSRALSRRTARRRRRPGRVAPVGRRLAGDARCARPRSCSSTASARRDAPCSACRATLDRQRHAVRARAARPQSLGRLLTRPRTSSTSIRLRLAGTGPAFAARRGLVRPPAPTTRAAEAQRSCAGRAASCTSPARASRAPARRGLAGSAGRSLLEAAFALAVPPLGLLAAAALGAALRRARRGGRVPPRSCSPGSSRSRRSRSSSWSACAPRGRRPRPTARSRGAAPRRAQGAARDAAVALQPETWVRRTGRASATPIADRSPEGQDVAAVTTTRIGLRRGLVRTTVAEPALPAGCSS